jgi:hypothetical protein
MFPGQIHCPSVSMVLAGMSPQCVVILPDAAFSAPRF